MCIRILGGGKSYVRNEETEANFARLMPTMALGSPAAFMDGYRHALMVITAAGQVYSW